MNHINVSLDSLDIDTFRKITGHDRLEDVLAGLERAEALPLKGLKVNAVLLRDGLVDGFSAWTGFVKNRPITVRFIELMRTGDNKAFFEQQHVSGEVLRTWLQERGWMPVERAADDGPATEFRHPDHSGRIGLIAPYAAGFCDGCNRLRVTARGQLRLCLFGQGGRDLRQLLKDDSQISELKDFIVDALTFKPAAHGLHSGNPGDMMNLAQAGG